MAASAPGTAGAPQLHGSRVSAACQRPSQTQEMVTPSISELTRVRTNLLCTVEGCAKVLSNPPALNMHLVKSHGLKGGLADPSPRKEVKGSQTLYCCPVEDCPRGRNRPFSRFSLVKQHFMKMHAEKKHKCTKCDNSYSTKGDLRRHAEDCGKVYRCGCGCPYASRAALLSHNYRTGHEVPAEHRFPPVRRRRTEGALSGSHAGSNKQHYSVLNVEEELFSKSVPKPKVVLVNVPVIQFAQVPVLLTLAENKILRSKDFAGNLQGCSSSAVQLLPQPTGPVQSVLGMYITAAGDTSSLSQSSLDSVSSAWQVSVESRDSTLPFTGDLGQRSTSATDNIQMDAFVISKGLSPASSSELLVSSCSQTDISVCAQVLLPINAETQTFFSGPKKMSSTGVQTDASCHLFLSTCRETQMDVTLGVSEDEKETGGCIRLSDSNFFSVSTQTSFEERALEAIPVQDLLSSRKITEMMGFGAQNGVIRPNPLADGQTQTMTMFSDLENMLCEKVAASTLDALVSCEAAQSPAIDFDIEDFLNSAHIQTQTDATQLHPLTLHVPLESLDTDTQTDYLFLDKSLQVLTSKAH